MTPPAPPPAPDDAAALRAEVARLRLRLDEAEETLRAIQTGGVDAVVVGGSGDRRVYTLDGADRAYRVWVEGMSQGAATLLADGAVTYCNSRLGELLGTPCEALAGGPFRDRVAPADRDRFDAFFAAARAAAPQGEFALARADGAAVAVLLAAHPLPPETGAAVGVLVTDLTAQKHHEQLAAAVAALRETEARFHRALRQTAVPTILHADDDQILLVNTVWTDLTGYRIEDIPTIAAWTRRAYGLRHESVKGYIDSLFAAPGRVDNGEWEVTTATGEKRLWHFFATPVGAEAGGRRLMVSNAIDVTDQKRADRENAALTRALRDADKRKDEFLATLAHELRNPLAPIRTGLQVLRLAPDGPEAAKARDMMDRQLAHMVRLIDDLLDVSRITRGKVELRPERVDLRAVVTTALEASRPLIEAARHELAVDLPAGALPLDADPTRLAQVFSNLLNNAAKYTPEGGRIELAARVDGAAVEVAVRDTGAGIPADMLPRVFELFTQVGRTLDRAQGGLGIGLTLVRRLLGMHGGTVEAASDGPGRGSTFTVRLPLAARAEPAAVPPAPAKAPRAARRLRVLVVDDNVDGADSLAMLLGLHGHDARTAHDGHAALAAAAAFRPQVVLLDIGLPRLNGYDVARHLRADPAFRGTVLIALTGWGAEEDRRRTRDAGFDHHLTKPVEPAAVAALLAGLVLPAD